LLWSPGDIKYADFPCDAGTYISVDPIVSKNNLKSDLTGVAVVGCANPVSDSNGAVIHPKRALVKFAVGVRYTGKELRHFIEGLMESFPEASVLLVETNQGGDLFKEVFEDLPIRVVTYKSTEKKEVRAGRLLQLYQNRPEPLVYHTEKFHQAETEMFTYPNMGDDITDAIGGAVLRWVKPVKKVRARMGYRHPG
jgi:phage terminase large subunit-like protein